MSTIKGSSYPQEAPIQIVPAALFFDGEIPGEFTMTEKS